MGQASSESGIWREPVEIHSYDVDFRKRATAGTLCRNFLEAAWNHAERLGIGYDALAKQNKLWVLARLLMRVHRFPEWGEHAIVATWPRGTSGVFALRDFELLDSQENRLAAGVSSWLILDSATHRPQRIDKLPLSIPRQVARNGVEREPEKLSSCDSTRITLTTAVRYSDIDVNKHVNSARYIAWLLDSYPSDFHRSHALRSLELNYLGETHWDDTVSISSHQHGPLKFSHLIMRHDRSELCRADLEWTADR